MRRKLRAALLLILSLVLLSSCTSLDYLFSALQGDTRFLADYSDITYVRPDLVQLEQQIDTLIDAVKNDTTNSKEVLETMEKIVDAYYYELNTMMSLAFLEYSRDLNSEFYRNEYYDLMAESDRLMTRLEELYGYLAQSPYRDDCEEKIFGSGFLEAYADGPVSYPEEFLSLFRRESELLMQYSEYLADPQVSYQGKIYNGVDIDAIEDPELYRQVCEAYYQKYNTLIASIYVELVGIRQEIARMCGYESYASYVFDSSGREYTPAEADTYLTGIRRTLVPIYREVIASYDDERLALLPPLTSDAVVSKAETLVSSLSGTLGTIFADMKDHNLYTVGSSDTMYYGSFQTYFNSFETPYLFVNGTGYAEDVMTMVHEFGHFTSAYLNYGSTGSNDEAEVASQALSLLSLRHLDQVFSQEQAAVLYEYELCGILSSLNECAAYTAFENMVYADTTLTPAECNAYFESCMKEYGLLDPTESSVAGDRYWVFINHLIEYPYYMIGYSVSADVSLQIFALPEEKGVSTYMDLIDRAYRYDFFGNLAAVGLQSPFEEGRAEALAAFFSRELLKRANGERVYP